MFHVKQTPERSSRSGVFMAGTFVQGACDVKFAYVWDALRVERTKNGAISPTGST